MNGWTWLLVYVIVGGALHFWPLRQMWFDENDTGWKFMLVCLFLWPFMLIGGLIIIALVKTAEYFDDTPRRDEDDA